MAANQHDRSEEHGRFAEGGRSGEDGRSEGDGRSEEHGRSGAKPPRPTVRRLRWTSFVAEDATPGRVVRGLHEETNPVHRLRVEHDDHTLLIHLSDEDGAGWTTIAVDRATRQCAVAQGSRQADTARSAYEDLYEQPPCPTM